MDIEEPETLLPISQLSINRSITYHSLICKEKETPFSIPNHFYDYDRHIQMSGLHSEDGIHVISINMLNLVQDHGYNAISINIQDSDSIFTLRSESTAPFSNSCITMILEKSTQELCRIVATYTEPAIGIYKTDEQLALELFEWEKLGSTFHWTRIRDEKDKDTFLWEMKHDTLFNNPELSIKMVTALSNTAEIVDPRKTAAYVRMIEAMGPNRICLYI